MNMFSEWAFVLFVMLCSELFLRSNQWLFFQLRVSLRIISHTDLLSSFPQWWNIMNVSHYVAVVHWANKLTDLTSVLHSFKLFNDFKVSFAFQGLIGVGVLSPHFKEWGWMGRMGGALGSALSGIRPGFTDFEKTLHLLGLHCFSYKKSAFS